MVLARLLFCTCSGLWTWSGQCPHLVNTCCGASSSFFFCSNPCLHLVRLQRGWNFCSVKTKRINFNLGCWRIGKTKVETQSDSNSRSPFSPDMLLTFLYCHQYWFYHRVLWRHYLTRDLMIWVVDSGMPVRFHESHHELLEMLQNASEEGEACFPGRRLLVFAHKQDQTGCQSCEQVNYTREPFFL